MQVVRDFKFFLILSILFFNARLSYAEVDFCAHIDDSIDVNISSALMFYKPNVFKEGCKSNVVVEEYPVNVIRIRGEGSSNQPERMIFKSDENCDTVVALPPLNLEETMDKVCQDFLGCAYRFKNNSLFYDLFSKTPERKIVDGKIQETRDDRFDLFEWSNGMSTRQHLVNRLILKSFQCSKYKHSNCNESVPPMFETILKPNLKVVFVIDVSDSVRERKCFNMNCQQYIIESFKSQLKSLDPNTMVNLYFYNANYEDGRRVFDHLVSIPELEKKFQTIVDRNLIEGVDPEDQELGIVRVPTHIFQLEELYDQPLDRVYVFSDFMDYRGVNHGMKWEEVLPIDMTKLRNASWELVTRSFAMLDANSMMFLKEFGPQRYLGHVPGE